MPELRPNISAHSLGLWGAIATIVGILFSGPFGLLLVNTVQAQPPWQGAALFVENYHPIQTFPFFVGFVLVSGYVLLIAAICLGADERSRPSALVAVMFASAFAALIFFNYILQTTFVPSLVAEYTPANDAVIGAATMANPSSLGWAIEMWGYNFLGFATAFAAPAFRRNPLERIAAVLFILNGIVSLVAAVATSVDSGWVLTAGGLVGYGAWNLLVLVMSILALVAFRRRLRQASYAA